MTLHELLAKILAASQLDEQTDTWHIFLSGQSYDVLLRYAKICPECGQHKPDDDRVLTGMKCGTCAGYAR